MTPTIDIKRAEVHNLKQVSVSIPRNQLVVITGVSGSGKSSLAFDTLFAEGQRRYVESLSAYARQFLGKLDKPKVESIKGIPPAVAIQQKVSSRNPRSTVGTTTEIYDYLKLLFARVGRTYSPISGEEVKRHQVQDVIAHLNTLEEGTRFMDNRLRRGDAFQSGLIDTHEFDDEVKVRVGRNGAWGTAFAVAKP